MRLFVAFELCEEARERLERLVRELAGPGVRWVAPALWHVTARFLGEVAESRLPEVTGALARATEGMAPFAWECRGCGAFPGLERPRVLWAGVGRGRLEMIEAAGVLEGALEGAGFPPEARPFHPHVTLGRAAGRVPARIRERLALEQGTLFGEGEAERIVLVESALSRAGPRYVTIGAWPLGAGLAGR